MVVKVLSAPTELIMILSPAVLPHGRVNEPPRALDPICNPVSPPAPFNVLTVVEVGSIEIIQNLADAGLAIVLSPLAN